VPLLNHPFDFNPLTGKRLSLGRLKGPENEYSSNYNSYNEKSTGILPEREDFFRRKGHRWQFDTFVSKVVSPFFSFAAGTSNRISQ